MKLRNSFNKIVRSLFRKFAVLLKVLWVKT